MNPLPSLTHPAVYRIRIAGRVHNAWSDFMPAPAVTYLYEDSQGVTELLGVLPDQSALFGLLCHIRDLGMPLVSVEFLHNFQKETDERD